MRFANPCVRSDGLSAVPSLAAPECEVVDADNRKLITRLFNPPAHDTQQGVVAHRHHQAIGKGCSRSATQRQPQMMNDRLETPGPSGQRSQNIAKSLGENATPAKNRIAPETTNRHPKDNMPAGNRQISGLPLISALDPA